MEIHVLYIVEVKTNLWVKLCVLTKAVCENVFSMIEKRVLRLSNGKGTYIE